MTEGREPLLQRLLVGSHPSALELLAPSEIAAHSWRSTRLWFCVIAVGASAAFLAIGPDAPGVRSGWTWVCLGILVLVALASVLMRSVSHAGLAYLLVAAVPLSALCIWTVGPQFDLVVGAIPAAIGTTMLNVRRRTAAIVAVGGTAAYAALVSLTDGYPRPAARVIFVCTLVLAAVGVARQFENAVRRVTDRELATNAELALARSQLEAVNVQLESRVSDQVGEIERLGRLRRFLSPQIADTVLTEGDVDLLATHRQQIAVVFVDLRGYTSFSSVAEPEDVMDLLTEFYAAVGAVLKRLEATVGSFAGDSVMAYFNDPVPCEDPAGRALEAAASLRAPMSALRDKWAKRGFPVGYGVGIAYGYATLGTIGFEERSDYTPIGSVVNLASRLCDAAADGEILLDGRAAQELGDAATTEPVTLDLKGFAGDTTAHRVTTEA